MCHLEILNTSVFCKVYLFYIVCKYTKLLNAKKEMEKLSFISFVSELIFHGVVKELLYRM